MDRFTGRATRISATIFTETVIATGGRESKAKKLDIRSQSKAIVPNRLSVERLSQSFWKRLRHSFDNEHRRQSNYLSKACKKEYTNHKQSGCKPTPHRK